MPAAFVRTHPIASNDRQSAQGMVALLRSGEIESASLVIRRDKGQTESVTIASSLIEVIAEYVAVIQNSKEVGIFADDPEVTPEQAAELLGMSRPTVVQRIRQGEIKGRMVGAHHRIPMSEVLAFRRKEEERNATLADLASRENSKRFAVANTVMEGGSVLPPTETLLDTWSKGEINDEDLIAQTLQRYAPGG